MCLRWAWAHPMKLKNYALWEDEQSKDKTINPNVRHFSHDKATTLHPLSQRAVHRDDRSSAENMEIASRISRTIILCWKTLTEYREQWHNDDDLMNTLSLALATVKPRRCCTQTHGNKLVCVSIELRASYLWDSILSHACIAFKCIAATFLLSLPLCTYLIAPYARRHFQFFFNSSASVALTLSEQLHFLAWNKTKNWNENKWMRADATSRDKIYTHSNGVTMSDNERTKQQTYGVTLNFYSIIFVRTAAFVVVLHLPLEGWNDGDGDGDGCDNQIFRHRKLINCAPSIMLGRLTIHAFIHSLVQSPKRKAFRDQCAMCAPQASHFLAVGSLRVQSIDWGDSYHRPNLSQRAQIEMSATHTTWYIYAYERPVCVWPVSQNIDVDRLRLLFWI